MAKIVRLGISPNSSISKSNNISEVFPVLNFNQSDSDTGMSIKLFIPICKSIIKIYKSILKNTPNIKNH